MRLVQEKHRDRVVYRENKFAGKCGGGGTRASTTFSWLLLSSNVRLLFFQGTAMAHCALSLVAQRWNSLMCLRILPTWL